MLNHQLEKAEDCYFASDKIRQNLVKMGVESAKADQINIFPINLHTALKGELEAKAPLVERSGFSAFSSAFEAWLALQSEPKARFDQFKIMVNQRWFDEALNAMSQKVDHNVAGKLLTLREQKALLESERDRIINETYNFIQTETGANKTQLLKVVGVDEAATEKVIDEMGQKVEGFLKDKFKDFSLQFEKNGGEKFVQMAGVALNLATTNRVAAVTSIFANKDLVSNTLSWASKELSLPMLKGASKSMLGTWASRISSIATVGLAIFDFLNAGAQEDAHNAQQRQQNVQRSQAADGLGSEFAKNAYQSVKQATEERFSADIGNLQNQMAQLQTGEEKIKADLETLTQTQSAMLAIYW